MDSRLAPVLALVAGSLPLSGCGGSDTETGAPAPVLACDTSAAAECLVDQHACVVEGGAPKCLACGVDQFANAAGACTAIEGTKHHHVFSDFTTQPGEEVLGMCQSWTLDNDAELWINAVQLVQAEASHHSNWTFVPETQFDGPDGVWPCDERNYDQLSAALAGGVIYAQSTQALKEVQKFPDGAVVRIPARSRIIGDVHLLNATPDPITGHLELTLFGLEEADVKVKLAPFHMTYDGLDIPPQSSSRFTGSCELDSKFQAALETPMSMVLYYGLPHTHAQGRRFFLEVIGGPNDGQSLLDVQGFNGEARGRLYSPPIDLAGATGLRFGCEFENPRPEKIVWGFGDQEMCEMLGFAEMDIAFESRVDEAVPDGEEAGMQLFTGACSTLTIPWAKKLE